MIPRDAITVNGLPLGHTALESTFGETSELHIACPPLPGARDAALRIGDVDLGPPSSTFGDPRWRWSWQPHQAAGDFAALLRVTDQTGALHTTSFDLHIVPSKLDADTYERLLWELQRDVAAVVWSLVGGRVGAVPQPAAQRSLVEEYALLVERWALDAAAVCDQILAQPHERLVAMPEPVPLADATRIDPPVLAELAREPLDRVEGQLLPRLQQALRPPGGAHTGLLPRQVRGYRTRRTHDLPEHRLLRHVLEVVAWRAEYVGDMLRLELERRAAGQMSIDTGAASTALVERRVRCAAAARSLRRRLALPFFDAVGAFAGQAGPTHLQRQGRYRRLGALYRRLRSAAFVAVDCPALWLPVAELPVLYEQWCVLRVVRALLPLGEPKLHSLIERDESGRETRWTLRLRSQQPLLELRLPDGSQAVLRYQRRYTPGGEGLRSLDSYLRIPDIAIEVTRDGARLALLFDAKYRVDPDGRAPQDALDDAYAYRGAIGVGDTRATIGAFLLFPGTVALETAEHVGALPLVPGRADGLEQLVRRLLG